MKTALAYGFYPEVKLDWLPNSRVSISAPWIALELKLPFDIKHESQKQAFIPLLAKQLVGFPLVFADTKQRPGKDIGNFQEVLNEVTSRLATISPELKEDIPVSSKARRNLTEIAEASRTLNAHDALAAFTHTRRRIFSTSLFYQYDRIGPHLHGKPRDCVINAIIHILNQTFYITSNCVRCLTTPNLEHLEFASTLRQYIKDESGHHLLIEQALSALGASPDEEKVHWSTRKAMQMLQWCAQYNPFALASCLSIFEMSSYSKTDPIAELLITLGMEDSAQPLLTHFDINKKGNHASIGLALSMQLEQISLSDVLEGALAADALCRLFSEAEDYYLALLGES